MEAELRQRSDLIVRIHLLNYIHISELDGVSDSHWPFGTEGGALPMDLFGQFLKNIKFKGTINMEMMPSGLEGIENLIDSYLILKKLGPKFPYILKKIRISLLKPLLMNKIKSVPLQAKPDKHNQKKRKKSVFYFFYLNIVNPG